MKQYDIRLAKVPQPPKDCTGEPVMLTDATIQERLDKVLRGMKSRGFEQLVVYGDAEHCGNFQYLMGYFTRFEESLLVLDADGTAHFVLGNENLNKASKARIPGQAVHVSLFSLPNQPNRADKPLRTLLEEAGIAPGRRIGIAGWKHFTSPVEKNEKLFDIPAFILDAIRAITGGDENLFNAGDLFLGDGGARTTNNANEIAHYEYGAALASDGVLDAMDLLAPGVPETDHCRQRPALHQGQYVPHPEHGQGGRYHFADRRLFGRLLQPRSLCSARRFGAAAGRSGLCGKGSGSLLCCLYPLAGGDPCGHDRR